jgi:flagellar basal body-associated protein FliL
MHVLQAWTLLIITIILVLGTVFCVGFMAAIAIALSKLNQKLEKLTNVVEPVAVKASDTLDDIQRVTMNVGEKADHILSRGVELTDNVSGNVEKTAAVVHQTVTTPLIKLSSVVAGVSKGLSVYTGRSRSNGHE